MNESIYRVSLDLADTSSSAKIKSKRGDTSRALHITLATNGRPYVITEECTAVFTATKPSGKVIFNNCEIEDNVVVYQFTEQTCAEVGALPCEIRIYGADNKVITSARFTMYIEPTVYSEDVEIESEHEINALTGLIHEATTLIAEVERKLADGEFKGDKGDPGDPGADGKDYVLTEEDKEEIAGMVGAGEVPALRQDVDTLKDQVADLMYEPITIGSLSLSVTTAELGSTVNDITATWSLNKEPVSQIFDGNSVDTSARSTTLTGLGLTANKTFTLKATDERNAVATKSATLTFMNGVYYGVLEDGIEIDSAAILTLTKSLQTARGITFTVNAAASQYIAYALPVRYGTPNFRDADAEFPADFKLAKENYSFTNGSGYTEKYNIWLSSNKGLGSTRVAVS